MTYPTAILIAVLLAALVMCALIIIAQHFDLKAAQRQIARFDHDGDGKPGGSRKRAF